MLKTAILMLTKINYLGDSIGNNIRIEIETENNSTSFDKKIKKGDHLQLNTKIGQSTSNSSSLIIPLTIRVIEKDLLFNDVGIIKEKLKINLSKSKQQQTYRIDVRESRGFPTRKIAQFYVTFEISVISGLIRYASITKDGWLKGKRDSDGEVINLPSHLKVSYKHTKLKREYITILEGVLQDTYVSITLDPHGKSYLSEKNPHTNSVSLTYSISKKTLTFLNKTYTTIDYQESRWEKGRYDIEIPDYSHAGGHNYPDAKLATVWFRVGHTGERYIHTGKYTLGCITLTEQKKWDALCAILMKARKGDGRSIGVLEVID